VVWLVPSGLQTFDTLFDRTTLSDSTWRLLYCLYGAPILMMVFLPDTYRRAWAKSEIFLDLFQIAIVVALVYSTFFFLPVRRMLPDDALLHNLSISDAQSVFLLAAVLVRLRLVHVSSAGSLLRRFALFLLVCAVFTFVGDWIDLHHYVSAAAWFNIAWNLNQAAPALLAITWVPAPVLESKAAPPGFLSFLSINLALVAMLTGMHLFLERWKSAQGEFITDAAVSAFLFAFTLRLALTQFHQQQEITRRIAAQDKLAVSHEEIGCLLEDARRQTAEITQISELGSMLHACTSREEVLRLSPERLRRLFPGASGSISLLSASRTRVESVAKWGICTADQIFAPEQCWALRRGTVHAHAGGGSDPRCEHLFGEGPSLCCPLIANGQTIGTLTIQDDDPVHSRSGSEVEIHALTRRRNLAWTVAEHIALAFANLSLRESLRLEAVRDPLTGLYNRRYMHEFLGRELHSARRKHQPLAVLMLDLDHFKRYNDNFGHSAGDKLLAIVGETLLRSIRAEDIACRYGGEEFTLILPECSLRQATVRAEHIRKRLKAYRAQSGGQSLEAVTVSIGVAAFEETTDRVDLLIKLADEALYEAKRAGRDRVATARPACAMPSLDFSETEPAPTAPSEST